MVGFVRCFHLSHHLLSKVEKDINWVLVSVFRFTVQKKGQSTTRIIKLLMEMLTTPMKACQIYVFGC